MCVCVLPKYRRLKNLTTHTNNMVFSGGISPLLLEQDEVRSHCVSTALSSDDQLLVLWVTAAPVPGPLTREWVPEEQDQPHGLAIWGISYSPPE